MNRTTTILAGRAARVLVSRGLLAAGVAGLAGLSGACGDDVLPPASECPPNAVVLGQAGQTVAQEFALQWEIDRGDGYLDDYLYFVVPDDILSMSITVDHPGAETAIGGLYMAGEALIDVNDEFGLAPLYHEPLEAASVGLPISESTRPMPGCMAIDPLAFGAGSGAGTLHIVTRRDAGGPAKIGLDVIVVGDTDITDSELASALDRMDAVYRGGGGLSLGDITYWSLPSDDVFFEAEGAAPNALRARFSDGDPAAITVFFIQDFLEEGTLGIAAGIPGPNGVSGTAGSGVLVSVDSHLDDNFENVLTDMMGETLAHEVGHQLGLFHTTEAEGTEHDVIDDTPECTTAFDDGDGELTAEECVDAGGRNFMFWTAGSFPQVEMTPAQVAVLRDSVVARPE